MRIFNDLSQKLGEVKVNLARNVWIYPISDADSWSEDYQTTPTSLGSFSYENKVVDAFGKRASADLTAAATRRNSAHLATHGNDSSRDEILKRHKF